MSLTELARLSKTGSKVRVPEPVYVWGGNTLFGSTSCSRLTIQLVFSAVLIKSVELAKYTGPRHPSDVDMLYATFPEYAVAVESRLVMHPEGEISSTSMPPSPEVVISDTRVLFESNVMLLYALTPFPVKV